jgi:hypothetical protein
MYLCGAYKWIVVMAIEDTITFCKLRYVVTNCLEAQFQCFMGHSIIHLFIVVKQGCLVLPTLFGIYLHRQVKGFLARAHLAGQHWSPSPCIDLHSLC